MERPEYALERWSLDDLFPGLDTPEYLEGHRKLERAVAAVEAKRPQLGPNLTPEVLAGILQAYDRLQRLASRTIGYAQLKFAEDTQDPTAQAKRAAADQLAASIGNRTLFFTLWWKGLPDEQAEALLAGAGDYRQWLVNLRREAPYTLSEPEERVVNLKDVTGKRALVGLYDTLTNRYTFRMTVGGEELELTRGELEAYRVDPRPEVRAESYRSLLRVYQGDEPVLGQLYQALVGDWRNEFVELRGYASPIAARNLSNDLPDDVVETLLAVCRERVGLFQRFFRLKARWIGVSRLRRYDLYAPVGEAQADIAFPWAIEQTLEAFQEFSPEVAAAARRVLDEKHYDGEVRKGKRAGAFCATIEPDLTPWILQSYQGRPRDLATLAHELGHAVHSTLASGHPALTQDPTLPLAETASTFGEMLLIDRLLAGDVAPGVRQALLFRQIDDNYATVMRQAYFARFEQQAHQMIQAGAEVGRLSDAYLESLEEQFGDSLDLSDDFRFEWLAIPHIYHTPFYVYAYTFGQLLVLSLYEQYRQEGRAFVPRYLEILRAGGASSPMEILLKAGFDVRQRAFWERGFAVIERAVDDLEALPVPTTAA